MKLIDKDALVAEIEKRVNFNKALGAYSRADECNAILSLIDTLEVKDLQEEPHCDERQFDELVKLQEGIGQIAKAVYEHKGKENPTVEKIREILIENSFDRMEIRGEISKKEEPVSKDLEKAAIEVFKKIVDSDKNSFLEIFKSGAEWQKKKTLKNAVDGIITFDYYSNDDKEYGCIAHDSFCLEDMNLKDRDKVKIAIIK